jgi:predicted RNase H-like HicB family nuclease
MCQSTAAALLEAATYRGELADTTDYLKATPKSEELI